jgi:hypothetical protein
MNPSAPEVILDHLLLGVADLNRGIEWVETRTGTRAAIGGSHPGRGTRNALVSLGGRQYLEIIAPDPAQPAESLPEDLRSVIEPRLVGWAAANTDLDRLSRMIREQGLEVVGPRDGSRAKPDGRMLTWRTLSVATKLAGDTVDPVPFFIEWARDTVHPSQDSPRGGRLLSLAFEHPDPERLVTTLRRIGIEAAVKVAASVRIVAELETSKGEVVFT